MEPPSLNAVSAVIPRSAADATDDEKTARENLTAGLFEEWPNEAGFSGLTEQRGPIPLSISGSIPPWAAGTLFRTGPAVYTVDRPGREPYHVKHWFDGLGQTHKFDIVPATDGTSAVAVLYSSRRQSDAFMADLQAGAERDFTFAQSADPCVGLFGKAMSVFRRPVRNVNVQVTVNVNMGGLPNTLGGSAVEPTTGPTTTTTTTDSTTTEPTTTKATKPAISTNVKTLWLATDGPALQQLDPITLEPGNGYTTAQSADARLVTHGSCAHAAIDPTTGEYFNFSLRYGPTAEYTIFRLPAAGSSSSSSSAAPHILARLHGAHAPAAYIHSCFLTRRYFVLCIPSTHLALNGMAMLWHRTILESIQPFDSSRACQWHVIDRHGDGGVVARFETPAGFFFHSTNAFDSDSEEDEDALFCEMLEYPNTDVLHSFYCDVMRDVDGRGRAFWKTYAATAAHMGVLRRYKFNVAAGRAARQADRAAAGPAPQVVMQVRGPHTGELPTINTGYATRPHRFVYSTVTRGLSTMFDGLSKADTQTGNVLLWSGGRGHTPGEPIFVANPAGAAEDDGVLLSVVLDGANAKSYLLCLNAQTMHEMGRAECDFAIGLGFHGVHARAA